MIGSFYLELLHYNQDVQSISAQRTYKNVLKSTKDYYVASASTKF